MTFKARRGAIVVMLGIMIVALVSISAISIDFSRLWALRNELQTSADAAAHAGAIQLVPPNNAANTVATAQAYANANLAMAGTVTVDSVQLGDWDDAARTFTANAAHTDAVNVVVSRQSTGLIMRLLGVSAPRIKARAIGWADAPVNNAAGCIKPVAVPFTQLMYKINVFRGIANTPDTNGLYRPFDQVADMAALSNMTATDRTFSLKIGSGQLTDTLGAISGEYQAVQLGKYWDAATQSYASPAPSPGASVFKDNMSGASCHSLSVGDSLITQTGVMAGPTVCGAYPGAQGCGASTGPGICSMVRGDPTDPLNTPMSSSNYGNCEDAAGNVGIDMKAAFYRCISSCNGNSVLEVSLLGSFTLTKVFPDNSRGAAYMQFDKAQIVGIFKPVSDPGTVGPGSTTLVKPIIVK
ncbi:MAG TPA: TadG family pilus assembly protein [Gemmatimonadaceae bacterium]